MATDSPDFDRLASEHALALRAYGAVQARCSDLLRDREREIARLNDELVALRGRLVARETALSMARDEMASLVAQAPGLPTRVRLSRHVAWLEERVRSALREATRWRFRAEFAEHQASTPLPPLSEKSVLCVGTDEGEASLARRWIEEEGGRFLHHAGDDEAGAEALEHSLKAADLVICQTGCVSHDAFWRVSDHCRRTGKQCVMVVQPSTSARVVALTPID